jgi:hypothetical protein
MDEADEQSSRSDGGNRAARGTGDRTARGDSARTARGGSQRRRGGTGDRKPRGDAPAGTGGRRTARRGDGGRAAGGGDHNTRRGGGDGGGGRAARGAREGQGGRAAQGGRRAPRQGAAPRRAAAGAPRAAPAAPAARGDDLQLAVDGERLDVGEVLAPEILDELRETARPHAFGDAARALAEAVVALSDEDDPDPEAAVRAARRAKRAAPRAASVREALGVALYQAGDYQAARTELAAAQRISGRVDLAAMLADIERALGRPERAVALFERTDRSRMEPDTAAELLLVAASAYGDLGQPAAGVALIRRHARWPVELAEHHLRLAYAEGALAEQAGDPARARAAFERVVRAEPDFHDAAERLEHLLAG